MYNQRMAELYHYGVGHKDGGNSGRYPWGSGKKPKKVKEKHESRKKIAQQVHAMSEEELDEKLKRLQKESQYLNLISQIDENSKNKGRKFAEKTLDSIGTQVLVGVGVGIGSAALSLALSKVLKKRSADTNSMSDADLKKVLDRLQNEDKLNALLNKDSQALLSTILSRLGGAKK